MDDENTVILLTACVNPGGMPSTVLQDVSVRLRQYKEALLFYLLNTNFRIVIVENTEFDFRTDFLKYIKNGRLEYLTFNGNDYNKCLGKGYGECLIIEYAMNNSLMLQKSEYIIKITGRLIIENISQLCHIADLSQCDNLQVACNIRPSKRFATSTFAIFRKEFLKQFFLPYINNVNESKGIWFEHVLYNSIQKSVKDGGRCLVFSKPIHILGIKGTKSIPYPTISWVDYILSWGAALLYNKLGLKYF